MSRVLQINILRTYNIDLLPAGLHFPGTGFAQIFPQFQKRAVPLLVDILCDCEVNPAGFQKPFCGLCQVVADDMDFPGEPHAVDGFRTAGYAVVCHVNSFYSRLLPQYVFYILKSQHIVVVGFDKVDTAFLKSFFIKKIAESLKTKTVCMKIGIGYSGD